MKKVLIIDAGCKLFGQGGSLNHYFAQIAEKELEKLNFKVEITLVDTEYNPKEEAEKIAACDFVILQFPGWWMNVPWQCKRYFDLVFLDPRLCGGDGRSRHDPTKKYGTGGLCVNTYYMLSSTWNAPKEAFTDKDGFFEGLGIDTALIDIHKPFQFIGMKKLKSFMANDVLKNPDIENDTLRFKTHLKEVFSNLA